jgi:hypothetical protein
MQVHKLVYHRQTQWSIDGGNTQAKSDSFGLPFMALPDRLTVFAR